MTGLNIIPFAFGDQLVRVVMREGEPWFVGTDLARCLEFRDASNALRYVPDTEKGTLKESTPYSRNVYPSGPDTEKGTLKESTPYTRNVYPSGPKSEKGTCKVSTPSGEGSAKVPTLGGERELLIVSEPGMYRLVFRSNKASARRFQDFVFHEVLPQIRKTGRYAPPPAEPPIGTPANDSEEPKKGKRVKVDSEFMGKINAVAECRRAHGIHAPRVLWLELGLPWNDEMEPVDAAGDAMLDSVSRFGRERIENAKGVMTPAAMLYRAYTEFCTAEHLKAHGDISFFKLLARFGFKKTLIKGRSVYLDIRIKDAAEAATP